MNGKACISNRRINLLACVADQSGENFACHSRATASNESVTAPVSACFPDLRSSPGSTSLSESVERRESLKERSRGVVWIELVLRRPQIADIGLDSPLAWTPTTIEVLLAPWIDKPAASCSVLPSAVTVDQLPALRRAKLKLWLLGEESAFDGVD